MSSESSGRSTLHRRRSHSSSSPLTSIRQYAGEKWRPSCKRARPSSTRSSSQKDLSFDDSLERQRDGKRVRRDNGSPTLSSSAPCLFGSSRVFRDNWTTQPSSPSSTHFPCTSDAFALFPNRRASTGVYRAPSQQPSFASTADDAEPPVDLTHLRSAAFWELQRSIAENGEGLVTRMRDWEEAHAQSFSKPEEGYALGPMRRPFVDSANSASFDEDEDEVQIIEAGGSFHCDLFSPSLSLLSNAAADHMGMDLEDQGSSVGTSFFSPVDASPCLSSSSDEDTPGPLTLVGSYNSPRASLPLRSGSIAKLATPSVPLASPSEKAIAALTLVMANGAGSLNDYGAVRSLEAPHVASLDDPLVGEMWH